MRWGPRIRYAHAVEGWYFGSGKVLSKNYWQQNSKTYSMNLSSLRTTWLDSENIKQLKSEDIDSTWEVYGQNACSNLSDKKKTDSLEVHYQDSKQQGFE